MTEITTTTATKTTATSMGIAKKENCLLTSFSNQMKLSLEKTSTDM